ncbi:ABC transporter permease [Sinosporangium siamense]|uniref:Transport permease protein n=1 Tax=Sinosporangium siamense TaxID=1367973 RepID=A0A919V677_9ACTN|nr:ABC transporter permease [Sinosporangium siamense]GII90662.1 hypothetical protein Ssi02_08930 [Sinosporangium siamense]
MTATRPHPARASHVGRRGTGHNLRAVKIVLKRELIRFANDGNRVVAMLFQAVLWLFVLGSGFGSLMPGGPGDVDLQTFMFPGVISMIVVSTSVFSAASIVWDREFGFLREMLVAPVSRTAIVIGKVLGGALVATLQGMAIMSVAGLVGVPYDPVLILQMAGLVFLIALTMTAFGAMVAARITSMEAFLGVSQMAVMPLTFLSGALFPVTNLPSWLGTITLVNPLTYAVDPVRQAVFARVEASPEIHAVYNPGVTWGDWTVPVAVEILVVAVLGLFFLLMAVAQFRRTD